MLRNRIYGWLICDFKSFSTVFQLYQDDGWMTTKDCARRNAWEDFRLKRDSDL